MIILIVEKSERSLVQTFFKILCLKIVSSFSLRAFSAKLNYRNIIFIYKRNAYSNTFISFMKLSVNLSGTNEVFTLFRQNVKEVFKNSISHFFKLNKHDVILFSNRFKKMLNFYKWIGITKKLRHNTAKIQRAFCIFESLLL